MRALLAALLAVAALATAGSARAEPFADTGALPPTASRFPRLVVEPPPAAPGLPAYRNRMVASPLKLPHGQDLCVVQRVEARAAPAGGQDPALAELGARAGDDGAGTADVATPRGVLDHVCKFAGTDQVVEKDGVVTGDLVRPENIEFRRVAQHFFSDVDPRADYAVLGTPGGDLGELINAMTAAEHASGTRFSVSQVSQLMQDYWHLMQSRGRKYFYMGTDEAAMKALSQASGAEDPTRPRTRGERNRVLAHAAELESVGCRHLRGMLERPDEYGVRAELVRQAVQVFWSVYFDARNTLREHLLLVVLKGELKPAGGAARVWSPDACPGVAPLLVPHTNTTEAVVVHEAHAKFFRLDLARFFSYRNAELDVKALYAAMNALAAKQAAHLGAYFSGPKTDIIFSSYFDRYPF